MPAYLKIRGTRCRNAESILVPILSIRDEKNIDYITSGVTSALPPNLVFNKRNNQYYNANLKLCTWSLSFQRKNYRFSIRETNSTAPHTSGLKISEY